MKKYCQAFIILIFSLRCFSQNADTLTGNHHFTAIGDSAVSKISVPAYFKLLAQDFTIQAQAPFHLHQRSLLEVAGFGLITGGVMAADEQVNHFAVKLDSRSGFVKSVSPVVTRFGGRYAVFTIGAIGAYSYIVKNEKLKTTTLLATQAYISSGVWVAAAKFISGRSRPNYYDVQTKENESTWHGFLYQFKKNSSGKRPDGSEYSSFPSGHTAAAFSLATVFAEMYKDKPWVPVVAYTSASLIGLSRITENKHWASDVLVGSALGYLCGKQAVRNFRRHERTDAISEKKKNVVSFNLNYVNKSVMTELVLTFQ